MTSLLTFEIKSDEIQNVIVIKGDSAESSENLHFIAACKIQAWFRGIIIRNNFRKLRKYTVILQQRWRSYRIRMFTHEYLVECIQLMWQNYCNNMAIRIQAIWRGHWTRKSLINFLESRRWLRDVYKKNDETLKNMKKFRQNELDHMENMTEKEAMLYILFILFKLHHLLRTRSRSGVITRIDKTRFTYIEKMLKCFEYRLYLGTTKSICKTCRINSSEYLTSSKPLIFHGTYFEKCEKEIREFQKSLRAGNVPIFRSEPFEERKGMSIKNGHSNHKLSWQYTTTHSCSNKSTFKKKRSKDMHKYQYSGRCLHQTFACTLPKGLYEAINKMDCQLDRLCLNCPIHTCFHEIDNIDV